MEEKKKTRCPLGVPGGVFATLLGLTGIIANSIHFQWIGLITSLGLFLLGMPFIRFVLMVHAANDRLDELERKMNEK